LSNRPYDLGVPVVTIDARRITDFESFHDVFAEVLGFQEFYGRNMDAWIDCMSYLDDPESQMTSIHATRSDPLVLHIDHARDLPSDVFAALNECAAFVNWRRTDTGGSAILALSYHR
jgi:hypothetical protein